MTTEAGSAYAGNPAEECFSGAAQTPETSGFFAGLDDDLRSFADNKGWTRDRNPAGAVLKSYRELEARLGNSVPLPAEGDDEALRKLFARLGMPDRADAYALRVGEGYDPKLLAKVQGVFHESGLTQKQASAVYDGMLSMLAPQLAEREAAERAGAEAAALTAKELGDEGMALAKAAFAKYVGKDGPELADKLQNALGDADMLRFFHAVGLATGEDGKGALGIGSGAGAEERPASYLDIVTDAFRKRAG